MVEHDPVKVQRETIEIEGGRNLYNYSFEIEDERSGGTVDQRSDEIEERRE